MVSDKHRKTPLTKLFEWQTSLFKNVIVITTSFGQGKKVQTGRAIEIVERALAKHGARVYVRHKIVHNEYVAMENASRALSKHVDVNLVIGSKNIFNFSCLREIEAEAGIVCYLIADRYELDLDPLKGAKAIGITGGASAPEVRVPGLIDASRDLGPLEGFVLPGMEENIKFRLSAELINA